MKELACDASHVPIASTMILSMYQFRRFSAIPRPESPRQDESFLSGQFSLGECTLFHKVNVGFRLM